MLFLVGGQGTGAHAGRERVMRSSLILFVANPYMLPVPYHLMCISSIQPLSDIRLFVRTAGWTSRASSRPAMCGNGERSFRRAQKTTYYLLTCAHESRQTLYIFLLPAAFLYMCLLDVAPHPPPRPPLLAREYVSVRIPDEWRHRRGRVQWMPSHRVYVCSIDCGYTTI